MWDGLHALCAEQKYGMRSALEGQELEHLSSVLARRNYAGVRHQVSGWGIRKRCPNDARRAKSAPGGSSGTSSTLPSLVRR